MMVECLGPSGLHLFRVSGLGFRVQTDKFNDK